MFNSGYWLCFGLGGRACCFLAWEEAIGSSHAASLCGCVFGFAFYRDTLRFCSFLRFRVGDVHGSLVGISKRLVNYLVNQCQANSICRHVVSTENFFFQPNVHLWIPPSGRRTRAIKAWSPRLALTESNTRLALPWGLTLDRP